MFEKVGIIIKRIHLQSFINMTEFYYFQGVIIPMMSSTMCKLTLTHRFVPLP